MSVKMILSGIALLVVSLNTTGSINVKGADKSAAVSGAIVVNIGDYPVRKETREKFQLSPNASVEVSGIEGSVEIETTDGEASELIFVREAKTQADYDCETIDIQQTTERLVVKHLTRKGKPCLIVEAREHLKLVVPRSVSLDFREIEGSFTAGATEGLVRLRDIEGAVRIERARAIQINSVESDISINVSEINSPGIRISDIEGNVEIGLSKELNAILKIDASDVQINSLKTQTNNISQRTHRMQLGAGGENISIFNIKGGVKVRGI
jgi:hypothetical protein